VRKHCLGSCKPRSAKEGPCPGPHCTGTRWKPVGKRDVLKRGNREFPMKRCRICGYQS